MAAVLAGALVGFGPIPPVAAQATAARPPRSGLVLPRPGPLPPGVDLSTELRRYPVRGVVRTDLSRSMFEEAPGLRGRRVWGRTEWRLESEYRFGPVGHGCGVADARVRVAVVILLPEWRDRSRGSPALRRAWDAFQRGLVAHELGHREVAVAAGAALRRALLGVAAPACVALGPRADEVTREVMGRWGDRQLRYDVETRRGRSQGARWPP